MSTASRQVSEESLGEANRKIGMAIGACLAMWYLPVVGGAACNLVESRLVVDLLETLGEPDAEVKGHELFWFHRKRMLVLHMATYAPLVGTTVQIVEVYSLGQFVLRCVSGGEVATFDLAHLEASWAAIEEDVLSGRRVVEAYRHATGKAFAPEIEAPFVAGVDRLSQAYRRAQRVPGLREAQERAGGVMRRSSEALTGLAGALVSRVRRAAR